MNLNETFGVRWAHDGRRTDGSVIPDGVPVTFALEFVRGDQRVQFPPIGEPALEVMEVSGLSGEALGLGEGTYQLQVRAYLEYPGGVSVVSAPGDGGALSFFDPIPANAPHGVELFAG